jgi:uncharacterized membrane protein (UPF0127 family)
MREIKLTFYPKTSKPVILHCEVAKTITEKMKGLMHRENLPSEKGMIFPFFFPWIRFFWMKNVKMPLDIIFVNRNLEIIAIYEAPVETGFFHKEYWSHGFCKYVIEANMGFCKKHGIVHKSKIQIRKN